MDAQAMPQVNTVTLDQYRRLSEKAWMSQIVELAKALGWWSYHPWLSIHSSRGWPDLALVRERLILVELKTEKGKLTIEQAMWVEKLKQAGVEVYVWRPSQFDEAVKVLSRRNNA